MGWFLAFVSDNPAVHFQPTSLYSMAMVDSIPTDNGGDSQNGGAAATPGGISNAEKARNSFIKC